MSVNGMVRPCSCPASQRSWQGARQRDRLPTTLHLAAYSSLLRADVANRDHSIAGKTQMPKRLSSSLWGLTVLCLTFCLTPSNAAQLAASIEYETIARPADVPGDLQPLPGASLRFLSIKTIDGFLVQAALWQPEAKAPAETTLVVMVHGSGGNYARAPNSTLGRSLSGNGFAALAINTRQHDDKRNTDNFLDTSRDIDAAVQSARALGYRSIVLQGHSLGTIQVLFYAATHWEHDIKAVVQLSAFGDLPWRTRYLQIQDEDKFRALSEAALKALHDGKERDVMALRMRRTSTVEEPLTGEHFLTYRAEASSSASGPYWIKRVPHPILLVRDAGDTIITPFEPYVLLSAATSPGSLVPSIKFVELPDPAGPNPGGHFFADNTKLLSEAIMSWIADQHL
jgi:pimeloyl-ACP methyl ester carboxylesterase